MDDNKIITLGEDWRSAPREFWGSEDRKQAALEEGLHQPLGTPPPTPARVLLTPGFELDPKPRKRRPDRSRQVDRLLAGLGIRPRRR